MTLEPWGLEVVSRSAPYAGAAPRQIPVWGRRRLLALARVLPLAEHFEVVLLGPGLPSIWIARLGEMTFTLALSGWTANDFTSGTNLDTLFAGTEADRASVDRVRARLETERSASFSALETTLGDHALLASALHVLAKRGEVVYDYSKRVYRFRPILPVELSERTLGPESPELVQGRKLVERVQITREDSLPFGKSLYVAKVDGTSCEGIFDADGQLSGARCSCSFHFRTRLRAGPCRHLLALRLRVQRAPALSSWRTS
jgi:hypothetical protein